MPDYFTQKPSWQNERRHVTTRAEEMGALIKADSRLETGFQQRERKHFPDSYMRKSATVEPRGIKFFVEKKKVRGERPYGIKKIAAPKRLEPKPTGRLPAPALAKSGEIPIETTMGNKKKLYDAKGVMVNRKQSNELSLETAFGKKRRGYSIEDKRNGIPRVPERDTFMAAADMIAKQKLADKVPIPRAALSPVPKKPTYEMLQRVRHLLNEIDGVNQLTISNPDQPSWEESTGMMTWKSKKSLSDNNNEET